MANAKQITLSADALEDMASMHKTAVAQLGDNLAAMQKLVNQLMGGLQGSSYEEFGDLFKKVKDSVTTLIGVFSEFEKNFNALADNLRKVKHDYNFQDDLDAAKDAKRKAEAIKDSMKK